MLSYTIYICGAHNTPPAELDSEKDDMKTLEYKLFEDFSFKIRFLFSPLFSFLFQLTFSLKEKKTFIIPKRPKNLF